VQTDVNRLHFANALRVDSDSELAENVQEVLSQIFLFSDVGCIRTSVPAIHLADEPGPIAETVLHKRVDVGAA